MYCPNCSNEASSDQKFCRLCGMDLQAVSKLVVGQSALKKMDGSADEPDERTRKIRDRLTRIGFTTMMGSFVAGCFILVIAGLDKYYGWAEDLIPLVIGIAGILLFVGVFTMTYSTMLPRGSRTRKSSTPKADTQVTSRVSEPPHSLPETLSTVTDGTTELFDIASSKAPVRDTTPQ